MSTKKKKPEKVLISLENLKKIYETIRDANEVIRSKYPEANHLERKGMKLMMDELSQADEICLKIIRKEN